MTTNEESTGNDAPTSDGLDVGGPGSGAGPLGGGSQLAAGGNPSSDTAAAALEPDGGAFGNSTGQDPDEDSSYPSAMTGSTNSTGHTVGLDMGKTGSNAADMGSEEETR